MHRLLALISDAVRRSRSGWVAALGARVLPALLVVLALWAVAQTRPWNGLNLKALDMYTALAAPGSSRLPVVILAIDDASFQQLRHAWPFPRSLHGQLLERLNAEGALAVGFDVLFSEPSAPSEDAVLEQALAAFPGVVLASAPERAGSAPTGPGGDLLPVASFVAAGAVAGDSLVQPDDDFVVRHPSVHAGSFAMRLAEQVSAARGQPAPAVGPGHSEFIVYRGPRGSFDTRSYYEALTPGQLPEGYFRGKIVLVGRSARAAVELGYAQADLFNSPFYALGGERLFPGVELQATLLDNLLTGAQLYSAEPRWALLYALLALAVLVWSQRRRNAALGVAIALLLVAGAPGLSWWLFARGQWLSPLYPMAAVLALYATMVLMAYLRARQRARQMRSMFAQYVPPAVVSRLVAQPELLRLGGEVREVTLMFTDLERFTTLSEQLSAQQTVEVLTACFNTLTPIIHGSGGTVDKFIGDAVMAFWGAPLDDAQHAEHAVRAALAMQAAMQGLAEDLQRRGLPPVRMRIGVHTGRVVVGNVGSEQRFSYTAIGDAVNVAARLEGANKDLGTRILVSGATAAQLPADLALRALDDVLLRGRSEAVRVFTPCTDAVACRLSEQVLQRLQRGDWLGCEAPLQALAQHLPGDMAVARLKQRWQAARLGLPAAQEPAVLEPP